MESPQPVSDALPSVTFEPVVGDDPNENPFVGPRPLRTGEKLRGRDREIRDLTNLLLTSRIVLLHAPSGAGKTSLLQTSVLPGLRDRGFQVCGAMSDPRDDALRAVRVNLPKPDYPVANRYVFSVVCGLLGSTAGPPEGLADMTLDEALRPIGPDFTQRQLLVLDQLEEVLTLDPTDVQGQVAFFQQLGECLDNDRRWALLSMREDFMGGLYRFQREIPTRLRAKYRLDFLDERAARVAIREPVLDRHIGFEEDAAQHLVDKLRLVDIQDPRRGLIQSAGPYVEPVLLQVVCHRMWRELKADPKRRLTKIGIDDVANRGQIRRALRSYYGDMIAETTTTLVGEDGSQAKAIEEEIRKWFDIELITRAGYRSQTMSTPRVDKPDLAIQHLVERYLIRGDPRAGTAVWYELTHDRLVRAVRDDNMAWRRRELLRWQVAEWDWILKADDAYLVRGEDLKLAHRALKARGDKATDAETAFVDASQRAAKAESLQKRLAGAISLLVGVTLVTSFLAILFALLYVTK